MGDKVVQNDKVYTSYFAVIDKHVMPKRQVSIAISTPSFFRGNYCFELNPTRKLLRDYKSGAITEEEYVETYKTTILNNMDPETVYNTLKGKVLCCWETKGHFCHRHIVAQWLKDELGSSVVGGEI